MLNAPRSYVLVEWEHQFESEPVKFFSELDEQRYEIRKVEVYKDGSFKFADGGKDSTLLSPIPFPTVEEISSQPECRASDISAQHFEEVWQAATSSGEESDS